MRDMSTPVQTPIMLRARISEQEHREIKKQAIDEDMHAADLLAELIRKGRECRAAERKDKK